MSLAQNHAFENQRASSPEELADEAVLAASQENPALFSFLVDRYQEPFLRAAIRVVRRREDAEDIVQEAFVKIYRNAGRFIKRENIEFKSWAYRIVLNTSFTHYQKLKKRGLNEDAEGDETLASFSTGHSEVKTLEEKMFIERVFEDLPPDLSRILRKHYLEDKAYETIAKEENSTIASVKMKLFRARRAFKKLLRGSSGSTNGEESITKINLI